MTCQVPAVGAGGAEGRSGDEELVLNACAACSSQDLDRLPSLVGDDVDWPSGVGEEPRLRGREALRASWSRQWQGSRTTDAPVRVIHGGRGRIRRLDIEAVTSLP